MKTSLIIGSFTAWTLIFILAVVAQSGSTTGASNTTFAVFQDVFSFTIIDQTNIITAAISLVGNIKPAIEGVMKIIFLWFPSLWTGIAVWFWYIFCIPTGIGVSVSIFTILRGVGSN